MATATKSSAPDNTIRQSRWMGRKLLAVRTIYLLAVAVLCLLAGESRGFTPVPGIYYRLETAWDGLLVSTNSVRSGNSPNAWAYAGDGSESWQFIADSAGTNYQLLSQAGNLTMGCNSGDPKVYLQTPATPAGSGQLWYVGAETNGYVALCSKLNRNAMTVLNPFTTWYQAPHQSLTTSNYYAYSNQLYWIASFRITPVQLIAVPPGYNRAAPNRMVLCSSNDLGASVTGMLSNKVTHTFTNVSFQFGRSSWSQHYYSNVDSAFATQAGAYTVMVSNFPSASFVVSDNFYRATTNGAGELCGISNILSGFFAYQRENDVTSGWEVYTNDWVGDSTNVVTTDLGPANRDVHGGWRDATSLDKETFNEAGALLNLAYAAEDAVDVADRTNLLGGVAWGTQYLLRIQNPDGTFPCSLGPEGNPPSILANVDCGICARAVAGLAAAARVLAINNPPLSSNCLAAATLSWGWVSDNYTNTSSYITDAALYQRSRGWVGSAANVLGAALELATTTANPVYFSAATNLFYAGKFAKGGYSWAQCAYWVKQVAYYLNGALLGIVSNAPFSLAWRTSTAGNFALAAFAQDSAGLTAASLPVNVTMLNNSAFIKANNTANLNQTASWLGGVVPGAAGLTAAYVYGAGAVIEDGGFAIIIAQPLLAPTSNGVNLGSLSVTGSGFTAPPIVDIVDSGNTDIGASAFAELDDYGNLMEVVITSPGVNYSGTPIFIFTGGGAP